MHSPLGAAAPARVPATAT